MKQRDQFDSDQAYIEYLVNKVENLHKHIFNLQRKRAHASAAARRSARNSKKNLKRVVESLLVIKAERDMLRTEVEKYEAGP